MYLLHYLNVIFFICRFLAQKYFVEPFQISYEIVYLPLYIFQALSRHSGDRI